MLCKVPKNEVFVHKIISQNRGGMSISSVIRTNTGACSCAFSLTRIFQSIAGAKPHDNGPNERRPSRARASARAGRYDDKDCGLAIFNQQRMTSSAKLDSVFAARASTTF